MTATVDSFVFYVTSCLWGAICAVGPVYFFPDRFEVTRIHSSVVALVWGGLFLACWLLRPFVKTLYLRYWSDRPASRPLWSNGCNDWLIASTPCAFGLSMLSMKDETRLLCTDLGVILAASIAAISTLLAARTLQGGAPGVRRAMQNSINEYVSTCVMMISNRVWRRPCA